jgi:hypothetical protein
MNLSQQPSGYLISGHSQRALLVHQHTDHRYIDHHIHDVHPNSAFVAGFLIAMTRRAPNILRVLCARSKVFRKYYV